MSIKRYYLTESHQGYLLTLKVKKLAIEEKAYWDDSVYYEMEDSIENDQKATEWRDRTIEKLCESFNVSCAVESGINLIPNDFENHKKPYYEQI